VKPSVAPQTLDKHSDGSASRVGGAASGEQSSSRLIALVMLQLAGPLSAHMAQHILLMNALAPLAAIVLHNRIAAGSHLHLGLATVLQVGLLWGWHVPVVLVAAMQAPTLGVAMQLSLFGAALWFWLAVVQVGSVERWRAIVALLITSKLFCLLGALMVFAPRTLYPLVAGGHSAADPAADQQLAGLLMLISCPASYLVGGLVIAARWFAAIERAGATATHGPTRA
jgi:putative membrane protein